MIASIRSSQSCFLWDPSGTCGYGWIFESACRRLPVGSECWWWAGRCPGSRRQWPGLRSPPGPAERGRGLQPTLGRHWEKKTFTSIKRTAPSHVKLVLNKFAYQSFLPLASKNRKSDTCLIYDNFPPHFSLITWNEWKEEFFCSEDSV